MRCPLIPVRMAKINNTRNNRCWERMRRKGNAFTPFVGMQTVQSLWKTVWRLLKKLKIQLPCNPAIALLGIYPRDTGVLFRRDTCTPKFRAALSTIAKVWKEPKCPSMVEWIKKMWYIYVYTKHTQTHTHTRTRTGARATGYYSMIKKNKSCHLQQHR